MTTDKIAEVWPTAEELGFPDEETCFGLQFGHGIGVGLYESPMISRVHSLENPVALEEGMVFALETYCAATDGRSAARIEEEVVVTATGCDVITRFPAEELLVAGRQYVRGADLVEQRCRQSARRQSGLAAAVACVRRRRAQRRTAMTGDTGTRTLADGRPGYRLVRREDVELADALPGRSSGLTACRLVDGTLGSTHMALTLVSLVDGHVDEHVHSFETSFYVLEGEPVLYLEGRGVKLQPGACGAIPVGTPHAFRCTERALVDRDGHPAAAPRRQRHVLPRGRRRTARRLRSTRATLGTTTSSCSREGEMDSIA